MLAGLKDKHSEEIRKVKRDVDRTKPDILTNVYGKYSKETKIPIPHMH